MTAWTSEELRRIGSAEELDIAARRPDGTLRKRVTIWVVRVGDELFVRSWRGQRGAWYRGTQVRHDGRIWAGGVEKEVSFVNETDAGLNERIDAAYHDKYRRYAQYVAPMVAAEARATTIKLLPQPAGA